MSKRSYSGDRILPRSSARFCQEPCGGLVGIYEDLTANEALLHDLPDPRGRYVAYADERLLERIEEVHKANHSACGYRRTWIALRRPGEEVGRGRVQRLMRAAGIQGAKRRGKPWRTTKPDPTAQRRPDLVQRDFSATAPNRLWVGDFTYLRSWEGVSYFAFVIDAFSRKVVGWQLASHMRTDLVLDALRMALGQREPGADFELVAHTDRGSPTDRRRMRRGDAPQASDSRHSASTR